MGCARPARVSSRFPVRLQYRDGTRVVGVLQGARGWLREVGWLGGQMRHG